MFFTFRSTVLLTLSTIASLSLVSCGESKVSQCDRLTASVKKSQSISQKHEEQLKALEQQSNLNNFNEAKTAFGKAGGIFKSFAGELKTVNKEFTGLNFNDSKLKDLQGNYQKALAEREKYASDASKLFDKASKLKSQTDFSQLVPEISAITEKSTANSQQIKKLDDEINTYCGTAK
ncbi:MAG: hypothetical protein KME17_20920 [Cyanosarcina radialis HA8281-LM2]|nr:hypothetical protein [Cyanosarcina radialis HA8281-LM2]